MNTPNLTPDPRPLPDLVDHLYAAAEAALVDYRTEPYGDLRLNAARASARAVTAALAVLDLPARDARIRAETLRWAAAQWDAKVDQVADLPAANLGQSWQRYQLTESLLAVAEWCRSQATAIESGANAPAENVAAGSVVSTEGSGQRCPSRIAHESGVDLRCIWHTGHGGPHGSNLPPTDWWWDDDDRVIAEGSARPRPHWTIGLGAEEARRWLANEPGMSAAEKEAFRAQVEGSGHPHPSAGPWTGPRPTLSVDTEGDTDANH